MTATPTTTPTTTTLSVPVTITHACGHQCHPTYTGDPDKRQCWVDERQARFCRRCSQATAQAITDLIAAVK
jgi:hypothetical protein